MRVFVLINRRLGVVLGRRPCELVHTRLSQSTGLRRVTELRGNGLGLGLLVKTPRIHCQEAVTLKLLPVAPLNALHQDMRVYMK